MEIALVIAAGVTIGMVVFFLGYCQGYRSALRSLDTFFKLGDQLVETITCDREAGEDIYRADDRQDQEEC